MIKKFLNWLTGRRAVPEHKFVRAKPTLLRAPPWGPRRKITWQGSMDGAVWFDLYPDAEPALPRCRCQKAE